MSAFGDAGKLMTRMDKLAKEPATEENAFAALDLVEQAGEVLDHLRDDIASEMLRERIGKLQRAMGWQA